MDPDWVYMVATDIKKSGEKSFEVPTQSDAFLSPNVVPRTEEVEKYSDIIEFNVETNNIFIDLATVNDTSLSPCFMFSAVAYFLLDIFLQYVIPMVLIFQHFDENDGEICPSEANWNQKIAATALMYYLYGTLGFTNVEQNYELMTFNNVQNTMFFAPTWRVWQSHCSDGRENILFLGLYVKIVCEAWLIPVATYVLFLENPDLADLILNSVAMGFLIDVPRTLRLFDFDMVKNTMVDIFAERGLMVTDFQQYRRKHYLKINGLILIRCCGLLFSYAMPVMTGICL